MTLSLSDAAQSVSRSPFSHSQICFQLRRRLEPFAVESPTPLVDAVSLTFR